MAEDTKKLICVLGATGNQGGSVARRFLLDPRFAVRGITRDPSSAASRSLASLGVEMVQADLDDPSTLLPALRGANVIFSVTQYWEPFFRPDHRARAAEKGVSCRRHAYDVEVAQGRNIADAAAATVDTLDPNGFLVSTLSHAGRCSGGRFEELYHFDGKAEVFPGYVRERHPELAFKMSCVQTGFFMGSHAILPASYFNKRPDGSFRMRFTTAPDKLVPHLDVNADMGNFVYAVHQMPPGRAYMAEGTTCSWSDWMALWGETVGAPASYEQVTFDEMVADTPDRDCGIEVAHMYSYTSDPGYDGGMDLLRASDIQKAGIECPMTGLAEWMARQDWSAVLSK